MIERVLEIGPSNTPATKFPGTLLQQAGVEYVTVDANANRLSPKVNYGANPNVRQRPIVADSARLPFGAETVSSVIMRSVFGEYSMDPEYTGSSRQNTYLGLYEAFRVLRPSGTIHIAEENTPDSPYGIGDELYKAGFTNIRVYPCQDMTNPHWQDERTKYWSLYERDMPDGVFAFGRPIDPKWSYLMTATRPDVATEPFVANVLHNGVWRHNQGFDRNNPTYRQEREEFEFLRAEGGEARQAEDGWDRYRHIQVIAAQEQTDLKTHMMDVSARTRRSLFYN